MSDREMKLGAAVALLVILWGGNWMWQKYSTWKNSAVTRRTSAVTGAGETKLERAKAEDKLKMLESWREQSLPADMAVAQSEYRSWLIEQLQDARLDVDDVVPQRTGQNNSAYQPISYQVSADGKSESVVRFLDSFYRSDQLHKITSLTLTPLGSRDVQMTLAVEALVVEGVDRKSGLHEGVSDRLALASADEYVERIIERNPFTAYEPPPPKREPRPVVVREEPRRETPPPRFNHAEHAKLTGVVSVGDDYQAWVSVQTLGERLYLRAGDDVEVGQFKGKVLEVRVKELVIETDEGVVVIRVGDTLTDGRLLTSTTAGS